MRSYHDQPSVEERHRHRYEVNPAKVEHFAPKGLHFTGHDTEGERMEILELDDHPFFFGVQYHPEFMSRPMRCVATPWATLFSVLPLFALFCPPLFLSLSPKLLSCFPCGNRCALACLGHRFGLTLHLVGTLVACSMRARGMGCRPSPPFFGFILASCGKLDNWLKNKSTSPVVSPAPSLASSPVKPSLAKLSPVGGRAGLNTGIPHGSPVKPSPVKTGTVKTGTV